MDQIKDLQPWFGLGGMQSVNRCTISKNHREDKFSKNNRLQQNKSTPSWMLMDGLTAGQNQPDIPKIKARTTAVLGLEKSSDVTSQKLITGKNERYISPLG